MAAKLSQALKISCEIVGFETKGDLVLEKPLHTIGSKGLFTAELEQALLAGSIDLALHCLKDLPTEENRDLPLIALGLRESAHDLLVLSEGSLRSGHLKLADLPAGSRVGTSSLRRSAQLAHAYPALLAVNIRGNVGTRLAKLQDPAQDLSALILAEAGLSRLGLCDGSQCQLDLLEFTPAPGQGALALQASASLDPLLAARLAAVLEEPSEKICLLVERAFLAGTGGGCQTPLGAHALVSSTDQISLQVFLAGLSDGAVIQSEYVFERENAPDRAYELGSSLRSQIA